MDAAPARVGIVPNDEYERRRRLWSALEDAYPVRFEGRERDALHELDAIVAIGDDGAESWDASAATPRLLAEGAERADASATRGVLVFSPDAALAQPLRGARLSETRCAPLAGAVSREREVVLATLDGAPIWTRASAGAHPAQHVACAPAELGEGEAL